MKSSENAIRLRYFDMLAQIGITKHMGSQSATEEMLDLAHISEGDYILDVGCGIGLTASYLVRERGCRVVGIDLTPGMIQRSYEQARRDKIMDRVEFFVADAQKLPFDTDLFDAVIIESVNAFISDRPRAFREYVRVTKPGGYVGMNESTWLMPPTQEAITCMGIAGGDLLMHEEWASLMRDAGLQDVVSHTYNIHIPTETKERFRRFGVGGILRGMARAMLVYFRDASSRNILKDTWSSIPKSMFEMLGYGVYAGQKPG